MNRDFTSYPVLSLRRLFKLDITRPSARQPLPNRAPGRASFHSAAPPSRRRSSTDCRRSARVPSEPRLNGKQPVRVARRGLRFRQGASGFDYHGIIGRVEPAELGSNAAWIARSANRFRPASLLRNSRCCRHAGPRAIRPRLQISRIFENLSGIARQQQNEGCGRRDTSAENRLYREPDLPANRTRKPLPTAALSFVQGVAARRGEALGHLNQGQTFDEESEALAGCLPDRRRGKASRLGGRTGDSMVRRTQRAMRDPKGMARE